MQLRTVVGQTVTLSPALSKGLPGSLSTPGEDTLEVLIECHGQELHTLIVVYRKPPVIHQYQLRLQAFH